MTRKPATPGMTICWTGGGLSDHHHRPLRQGRAEGYAISEDGQAALDETVTTLNNAWVGQYNTRNEMIRSNYGPYMTYDHLLELLEREALVSDYASTNKAAYTYSQADYESYYQENKDALDTFTTSQLALRASVPTTDENGDTLEMTEAGAGRRLEEAKAEVKAKAEEILAKMEAGEEPAESWLLSTARTSIPTLFPASKPAPASTPLIPIGPLIVPARPAT